jgi:hypothetical protein
VVVVAVAVVLFAAIWQAESLANILAGK